MPRNEITKDISKTFLFHILLDNSRDCDIMVFQHGISVWYFSMVFQYGISVWYPLTRILNTVIQILLSPYRDPQYCRTNTVIPLPGSSILTYKYCYPLTGILNTVVQILLSPYRDPQYCCANTVNSLPGQKYQTGLLSPLNQEAVRGEENYNTTQL